MRTILFALLAALSQCVGCQANAPPMYSCPAGQCCYVGTSEFDLAKRSPVYMQQTDQTTVTSNIPCGSQNVTCGGGMCCWAGYICGPVK